MALQTERAKEINNDGPALRTVKNIFKAIFAVPAIMSGLFLKGIKIGVDVAKAVLDTHTRRLYGWAQQVVQKGVFVSISNALGAISNWLIKKGTDPVVDAATAAHEAVKVDDVLESRDQTAKIFSDAINAGQDFADEEEKKKEEAMKKEILDKIAADALAIPGPAAIDPHLGGHPGAARVGGHY